MAALIIAGVVLAVLYFLYQRQADMGVTHPTLAAPALLAAALPALTAWLVLSPGEPLTSQTVDGERDVIELEVPAGHCLLATATLAPSDGTPEAGKTDYALNFKGEGWSKAVAGLVKRKSEGGQGAVLDVRTGDQISQGGRKVRAGTWGEDLQERFDVDQPGKVEVRVTNWQGKAAAALHLDVVRAPPPSAIMWVVVGLISAVAIALEVKLKAERYAGDVAFLGFWALFMRDRVTPMDDFQELLKALAPAALVGWGVVAGLAWLATKYLATGGAAAPDAAPAAANSAPAPASAAPTPAEAPAAAPGAPSPEGEVRSSTTRRRR
jgi:hypothetical protein